MALYLRFAAILAYFLVSGAALRSPKGESILELNTANDTRRLGGTEYQYFEKKYAAGWFSPPPILDTHVESTLLDDIIDDRKDDYIPSTISVYTVDFPTRLVYYNIFWAVNSENIDWKLTYGDDVDDFRKTLAANTQTGFNPYQIETYAHNSRGQIHYAAIFYASNYWPDGTLFEVGVAIPKDTAFCCDPDSRWVQLTNAGLRPISVSITQDPDSLILYAADVWINGDAEEWQGEIDKSAVQLHSALSNLHGYSPAFLKGYKVNDGAGTRQIRFVYLAKKKSSSLTLTTDTSESAFKTIATFLKDPPVAFTAYSFDGEEDFSEAGHGGMYTALWEGVTNNI